MKKMRTSSKFERCQTAGAIDGFHVNKGFLFQLN